jgi:type I restriction enzyme S subunit
MSKWKEAELNVLCTKITDGSHQSPKECVGGSPMFSVKDMENYGFNYSKVKTISEDDFNFLVRQGCKPNINDILIAKDGSVLKHIFKVKDEPNYVLLSSIAILRPKTELINPDYLVYALKSPIINDLILSNFVSGSGVPRIVLKDFKKVNISFPPLPEQERIAEVLLSLDDKIDLLQRNNKTLEQLAETLFRQWLSKLQDRESATIGDYVKVQNGYAFKSNDFKDSGNNGVLKITNISFEHVDIQNTQFIDDKVVYGLSEKFLAKPKSFLIAMTGAEIGKIGIIGKTNKKLYINQRVGMLIDIEEDSSLLGYLFLKSAEGQDHIITTCTGSAQENISSVGIESMIVPKITKEEVLDICRNINPLFEKIIYNLEQIQQLELLRDTLLPKLMSGLVRVEN